MQFFYQDFLFFDIETNLGKISVAQLREFLTTKGNVFTEEQANDFFQGAPIKDGLFDYMAFIQMLKVGMNQEQQTEYKRFSPVQKTINEE